METGNDVGASSKVSIVLYHRFLVSQKNRAFFFTIFASAEKLYFLLNNFDYSQN